MPSFAPARCCSIVRPPGEPEPITAPLAPVPDGTPWLAIAIGATLALAAAIDRRIDRRPLRLRRRVAPATT